MNTAIARIYWRSVQRGARAFGAIPDNLKDTVRALARADVEAGILDREAYLGLTGESYPDEAA